MINTITALPRNKNAIIKDGMMTSENKIIKTLYKTLTLSKFIHNIYEYNSPTSIVLECWFPTVLLVLFTT